MNYSYSFFHFVPISFLRMCHFPVGCPHLPSPVELWQSQQSWDLWEWEALQQWRQRLSSMCSSRPAEHPVQFLLPGPLHSMQLSWHFLQLKFSPCKEQGKRRFLSAEVLTRYRSSQMAIICCRYE